MAITFTHTANLGIYDSQVSGPTGFNRTGSWDNIPIGTASSDRLVVFVITCRDYTSGNEMDFDGSAADNLVEYGIGSKGALIIGTKLITSGTTCNVDVRFVSFPSDFVGAVYTLTGANTTAIHSSNTAGLNPGNGTLSIELDAPDGGVIIAAGYHEDTQTTEGRTPPYVVSSWSGVTVDYEDNPSLHHFGTVASNSTYTASSTYGVSLNFTKPTTVEQRTLLAIAIDEAPPANITGTVSVTEAADTLSSNTIAAENINVDVTEADDTVTAYAGDSVIVTHVANLDIYDSQVAGPTGFNRTGSWDNISIGTASSDRIIVVSMTCRDYTAGNEVDIDVGSGPEAMTVLENGISSKALNIIAYKNVPSGTSANIDIRFVSFPSDFVGAVYTVTGAELTHYTSNTDGVDGTANVSVEVDAPAGGAIFATSYHEDTATSTNATITWTGVDVDYENNPTFNHYGSVASKTFYSPSTTYTVACGWDVGTFEQKAMLAVVFEKAIGTINGSLNSTEANDSLSSSAIAAENINVDVTEADDTLSSLVEPNENINVDVAEDNDTLSSNAVAEEGIVVNVTEADDTLSSSTTAAENIVVDVTEADDTLSSNTNAEEGIVVDVTEDNETLSANADNPIDATSSTTDQNDTLSSEASAAGDNVVIVTEADDVLLSITDILIEATSSTTNADETLNGYIQQITAIVSVTEANDTLSSSAIAAENINVNVTEADETLEGYIQQITAVVNVTEESDAVDSIANNPIDSQSVITEADDSLDAFGILDENIIVEFTEENDIVSSSGSVFDLSGSVNVSEESEIFSSPSISKVLISGYAGNIIEQGETTPGSTAKNPVKASLDATEQGDNEPTGDEEEVQARASDGGGKRAHRNGDPRVCGAVTVVTGQSSVFIDGQLWAVKGDPNSHGAGNLINTTGSSVTINGKPVIVHGPDDAASDLRIFPPHNNPRTADGSASCRCYPG